MNFHDYSALFNLLQYILTDIEIFVEMSRLVSVGMKDMHKELAHKKPEMAIPKTDAGFGDCSSLSILGANQTAFFQDNRLKTDAGIQIAAVFH